MCRPSYPSWLPFQEDQFRIQGILGYRGLRAKVCPIRFGGLSLSSLANICEDLPCFLLVLISAEQKIKAPKEGARSLILQMRQLRTEYYSSQHVGNGCCSFQHLTWEYLNYSFKKTYDYFCTIIFNRRMLTYLHPTLLLTQNISNANKTTMAALDTANR